MKLHSNSSNIKLVFTSIISTEFHLCKLLISLGSHQLKMLIVDTPDLWGKGRDSSDNFEGK